MAIVPDGGSGPVKRGEGDRTTEQRGATRSASTVRGRVTGNALAGSDANAAERGRVVINSDPEVNRAANRAAESAATDAPKPEPDVDRVAAERAAADTTKADRAAAAETAKAEKAAATEAAKADRAAAAAAAKAEKAAAAEAAKAEKAAAAEAAKADRAAAAEAAKAEKARADAEAKAEREAAKAREKADREAAETAEKAQRTAEAEAAKAERDAAKALERAEREDAKAREKAEREDAKAREKAGRGAAKAAARAEREAAKAAARSEKSEAKAAARSEKSEAKAAAKAEKSAARAAAKAERAKRSRRFRRDLRPNPFPVISATDWERPAEAATVLFKRAEYTATEAIDWYLRHKRSRKRASRLLRALSILFAAAGMLVPMLAGAFDVLRAEYGFGLLGLAAACVAFDHFFGLSSGWMRDMVTAQALHHRLEALRFDWAAECARSALTTRRPMDEVDRQLTLLRGFSEDIVGLTSSETAEWMAEFQTSLAQVQRRAGATATRAAAARRAGAHAAPDPGRDRVG